MDLAKIRNFGIAAHIDAGKTTVSERFLYYSGREHRLGAVDDGTTALDWMGEERERGITITAAATRFLWNGLVYNLIDTPGHVDFTAEVERAMRVLDGVVIVFCGVAGVQAQSETVWRQADRYRVPRLAFVNKLDRSGADFDRALRRIRERLRTNAVALQLPIVRERDFQGVVDLLAERAWVWRDEKGEQPLVEPVPSELAGPVQAARTALLEALADLDEGIMAAYLEGGPLPVERLQAVIRRETIAGRLVPVFCGAALRNRGIQPLMDAVGSFLPSPLDLPPVAGVVEEHDRKGEASLRTITRPPHPEAPLSALIFKVFTDRHGELYYTRVYSGTLAAGDQVYNSRTGKVERIGRLLLMHANEGEAVKSAGPGEIVAIPGLRFARTGDTLHPRGESISLEPIRFPEPVISLAIEPRSAADRDRLLEALDRLQKEDPTFRVRPDEETGQMLIFGMGELHLEIIKHRLERDFSVAGRIGTPRVSYRETVAGPAEAEAVFDRILGGRELYARVRLRVRPADSARPEFAVLCPPEAVPREFHEAIRQGVLGTAEGGLSYGYPMVNVAATLVGGEWREGFTTEAAFQAAGAEAFRKAVEAGGEVLLEPIMAFEVQTPPDFTSAIMADLNARRAQITETVMGQDPCLIRGEVPLSQMFGYSTMVRSLSQGRAEFTMEPARFAPVPAEKLEQLFPGWR